MARVTLKSRLPEIAAELRPRVSAAVKETAEVVAAEARARVPVDSGDLKDSITVTRKEAAGYSVNAEAQDDNGLYYGWFQEFGTRYDPPQPFLIPALEANHATAEQFIAASLRSL